MSKINFKSDELLSFYELWSSVQFAKEEKIKNLKISDKQKENSKFVEEAMQVMNTKPKEPVYEGFKNISRELFKEDTSIKNISDFSSHIKKEFPKEFADRIIQPLEKMYNTFSQFYNSSEVKKERENAVKLLDSLQRDQKFGYQKELGQMYDFFGVSKDFKMNANINVYKTTFASDGSAGYGGFFINPTLDRKNAEGSIFGTVIQEKKVSTPLHESAHMLFSESGKDMEFIREFDNVINNKEPQNKGMYKVTSTLNDYFIENPKAKREDGDSVRTSARSAIHEAFGACASMIIDEKTGMDKKKEEWYSGFEGANKLAPLVYPLFREYMNKGKKLDDSFFIKLSENMKDFNTTKEKTSDISKETKTNDNDIIKQKSGRVSEDKITKPIMPSNDNTNSKISEIIEKKNQNTL